MWPASKHAARAMRSVTSDRVLAQRRLPHWVCRGCRAGFIWGRSWSHVLATLLAGSFATINVADLQRLARRLAAPARTVG